MLYYTRVIDGHVEDYIAFVLGQQPMWLQSRPASKPYSTSLLDVELTVIQQVTFLKQYVELQSWEHNFSSQSIEKLSSIARLELILRHFEWPF